MLLRSLRCLRRELFTYLSPKHFQWRFNAFRGALFCLTVLYANYLYVQLIKNLSRVLLIFLFLSRNRAQRGRHKVTVR